MERERKHRIACSVLDEIVSCASAGERLPGIRELVRISGCGRPVVEQELYRLASKKRIRICSRQGIFKTGRRYRKNRIAVLYQGIYPAEKGGFSDILFDSLREHAEQDGFSMGFIRYIPDSMSEFRKLLSKINTDKIILTGAASREFAEVTSARFPYMTELLPRHDAVVAAEVRDSPDMTKLQLEYLFMKHYQKIGFLHHVEQDTSRTPVEYHRLFDYYRIMSEHGMKTDPRWVFYAPWKWEEFNRRMEVFFSCGNLPDALIIPGSSLKFFYRYCENCGIEIGRDIAVMGCDRLSSELTPKPTVTTNDPLVIAEEAWKVMKQRMDGTILHLTTELKVLTGESLPGLSGVKFSSSVRSRSAD